jgi:hypothetical protein
MLALLVALNGIRGKRVRFQENVRRFGSAGLTVFRGSAAGGTDAGRSGPDNRYTVFIHGRARRHTT